MMSTHPSSPCAVIFDLDGVLVTTDELHYQSWLALTAKHKIPFDRMINHRLRGIGRLESLDIILEGTSRTFSEHEKLAMATEKNADYRRRLAGLGPDDLAPGAADLLDDLAAHSARMAIASSSKNAGMIVDRLGIRHRLHALVDGNDISASKPDPEVFLKAAAALNIAPSRCIVIEDAQSGVEAARAAGMRVIGLTAAHGEGNLAGVDDACADLEELTVERIFSLLHTRR
ncbi:MAG: beta-phosphoglucomutase [Planctomycetes bacterium]|nr:beta-phosphoglucomutase [Planctomycetota bacterium]NOG52785.1 beta-phosphoglucomutase [Planctomycetota bacterium]